MIYNLILGLVVIWILNACGGGKDKTPKNNVPIVIIETVNSIIEGSVIELNASNSYDVDDDNITFLWKQNAGIDVVIVNSTSATPSFIAPEVDGNSIVELKLTINDGKSTNEAKIDVTIIDIIKEDNRQEVIADKTSIESSNGMVNISYKYNKTPINEVTSGLVLNIYWNSQVLEFSQIIEKFNTDFMGISTIKDDIHDKDSNNKTDKYLSISWVNLEEGNWKTPTTLPMALFDLEMKEVGNPTGTTSINIDTSVDSPGLNFYSSSVLISLGME